MMTDPAGISRRTSAPLPGASPAPSTARQAQPSGTAQKLDLQQLRDLRFPPVDHPGFELPAQHEQHVQSLKVTREAVLSFLNDGICPQEKKEIQALAVFLVKNKLPGALSWLLVQSGAETLALDHCDIGNEEVGVIADWAKTIPFQIRLTLQSTWIDADGAALLADALSANTITHLDLSANLLRDKGVEALCAGLQHNISLRSLALNLAGVKNAGIEALAVVLDTHPALADLALNGNEFDDQGAATLAGALGRNKTLSTLSVLHSGLADAGLADLATALSSNTRLQSLKFSGKDEPCVRWPEALAKALTANQTLESLLVISRPISDVAALRLGAAVAVNTTLRDANFWAWFGKPSIENAAVTSQISEKVRANALIAGAGLALSELSRLPESSVPIPPEVGRQIAAFAAQVAEARPSAAMKSMVGSGPLGGAAGPDSSHG